MSARLRKLIGVAVLLPALGAYLFGAGLLGALIPPRWYLQAPFYVIAGVLWAFPAIAFVRWMERGAPRNDTQGETRR
ncbi:MAG: DUF2842 domain-containing protein [Parvularculaceae bacterium]